MTAHADYFVAAQDMRAVRKAGNQAQLEQQLKVQDARLGYEEASNIQKELAVLPRCFQTSWGALPAVQYLHERLAQDVKEHVCPRPLWMWQQCC